MTNEERTVQVPVSSARRIIDRNDAGHTAPQYDLELLRALLSQAPATEPKPLNPEAVQRVLDYHGWPPRIEDMAPGTAFTVGDERWKVGPTLLQGRKVAYRFGMDRYLDTFDPSTIRDVTPPHA